MRRSLVRCLSAGIILVLSSCTTISNSELLPLGDLSKRSIVVGSTAHIDILGIGTSNKTLSEEFQFARIDAMKRAPFGTTLLKNAKAYKYQNFLPQIVGLGLGTVGFWIAQNNVMATTPVPGFFYVLGGVGMLIDYHDFVVLGEPSSQSVDD